MLSPRSTGCRCALLLVALSTWTLAAAQQAVPPQVQPGAAERQLQHPPEPTQPDTGAAPSVLAPQPAPPGAEAITFTLQTVDLQGVRAVPANELAAVYRPDLGKQITLSRVYGIANAMTAVYRSHGFLLSSVVVPKQRVEAGRVQLIAVEGFLHDVTFSGYTGARPRLLESIKQRLLADRPLRTATLEREMLLLNDLPGIQAQAVLLPAVNAVAAADLEIRLRRGAVAGSLGFNNRGSKLQGPAQTDAAINLNSVLGLFEGTSLQYLGALPASELHLFALTHVERLTSSGLDLSLNVSHSNSKPELGVDFGQFNLETRTTQARIQLAYPFLRTRADSLSGRFALTYHDGSTDSLGASIMEDKLAAVRIGLRWDNLDAWAGVNLFDLELAKGLNTLGASPFGSQSASRPLGNPDFFKTSAYAARLQSLGGPFSLLLALDAQYATDRLLEPEEFSFGGEPFGRAYDISEMVGDSGVAGKAELRATFQPLGSLSTTVYVFADRGEVWRRLLVAEAGFPATDAASSAGGGVRFSWNSWLTGYVEGAKPLDHIVAARGNESARVFAGFEILLGP